MCAALVTAALPPESRKCAKVCCPAPAKSKVCKSVLPYPYPAPGKSSVYEKVYSVA